MSRKITKNYRTYQYDFEDKTIRLTDGEVSLRLEIRKDNIHIYSTNGSKDFVFRSVNKATTLKRWQAVIDCLQIAIKVLESERKKI